MKYKNRYYTYPVQQRERKIPQRNAKIDNGAQRRMGKWKILTKKDNNVNKE